MWDSVNLKGGLTSTHTAALAVVKKGHGGVVEMSDNILTLHTSFHSPYFSLRNLYSSLIMYVASCSRLQTHPLYFSDRILKLFYILQYGRITLPLSMHVYCTGGMGIIVPKYYIPTFTALLPVMTGVEHNNYTMSSLIV